MNKIAIAFLAAASLASFGCKKKGGGDSAAFEKHVDAVCACKDQACLDKENADYMKANTTAADPEAAKKMADDPKVKELTQKLTECTTKVMTSGAAGGMAGTPPAGTPPAGGAAPAAGSDTPPAAPAAGSDTAPAAPAAGSDPAGSGSAK